MNIMSNYVLMEFDNSIIFKTVFSMRENCKIQKFSFKCTLLKKKYESKIGNLKWKNKIQ